MPESIYRETGHQGTPIISLGGVPGLPNHGRIIRKFWNNVLIPDVQITGDNPRRISCLIMSDASSPDYLDICLGLNDGSNPITLWPGDSLQIDKDFPWTGAIYAYSSALGALLNSVEISVE